MYVFITSFHSTGDGHHHILTPVVYKDFHIFLAIAQFLLQVSKFPLGCFVPLQELIFSPQAMICGLLPYPDAVRLQSLCLGEELENIMPTA